MEHRLEPELRRLYEILRAHPEGVQEYEILEALRGSLPLRGLDELGLFQVHFLLFHHLYRLKHRLETQGMGSLEIHCLKVRWLPLQDAPPNPEALPQAPDPLAEYYLDADNLTRTTREDVQELLQWFWRRYRVYGRREEALEVLGLPPGATPSETRHRFRELARRHHPDRGGDASAFQKVAEAMEVLRLLEE